MEQYLRVYWPAFFFFAMADNQRKFMNNMGRTVPPMLVQLAASSLHPVWAYTFTFKCGLGIQGIGLAGMITNVTIFIALLIQSQLDPVTYQANYLPDSRVFFGLWE